MKEKIIKAIESLGDAGELNNLKEIKISVLDKNTLEVDVDCESKEPTLIDEDEIDTVLDTIEDAIAITNALTNLMSLTRDRDDDFINNLNESSEKASKTIGFTRAIKIVNI